jgi:sulfatase maturation enzyme AslB (radical SAM superfamily)
MSAEKSGQTASFLFERERGKLQRSFSTMVKVVGPVCNLDCDYCYY